MDPKQGDPVWYYNDDGNGGVHRIVAWVVKVHDAENVRIAGWEHDGTYVTGDAILVSTPTLYGWQPR